MSRPLSLQTRGILLGLLSASFWALYNVGAKKGQALGFTPLDLTLLRYTGGALLGLGLLMAGRLRLPPLGKALGLSMAVGPLFGIAINSGFHYAPLSHGVLIGPSMSMVVPNLLMWALHGQRPSVDRLVGIAIVVLGLAVLAGFAADAQAYPQAWIGDLCFVVSGSLWGVYVYLMGRWQLPALGVTAAVGMITALCILPFWALQADPGAHALADWAEQFVFHGVMGGAIAFVVFGLTVNALGAGRASLFSALTPSFALLAGIPMLGSWPDTLQWTGVLIATLGMAIALDLRALLRHRRTLGDAQS